MPRNSPSCVPRSIAHSATVSSSATSFSAVAEKSENAACRDSARSLIGSRPRVSPIRVWSSTSSAKMSSIRSMFPSVTTSSNSRRTICLFDSVSGVVSIVSSFRYTHLDRSRPQCGLVVSASYSYVACHVSCCRIPQKVGSTPVDRHNHTATSSRDSQSCCTRWRTSFGNDSQPRPCSHDHAMAIPTSRIMSCYRARFAQCIQQHRRQLSYLC